MFMNKPPAHDLFPECFFTCSFPLFLRKYYCSINYFFGACSIGWKPQENYGSIIKFRPCHTGQSSTLACIIILPVYEGFIKFNHLSIEVCCSRFALRICLNSLDCQNSSFSYFHFLFRLNTHNAESVIIARTISNPETFFGSSYLD